MRDRLIEIIKNSLFNHIGKSCNLAENIADDLLNKNVIVPPCKYGDTIYEAIFHKDGTGFCVERKVVGFHMGEFPKLRGQERQQYFIVFHEATNSISHMNFKEIGKTIFFTREEAEQALKGESI